MISKVNRGDVFIYNFGSSYSTSVESKERPSLIISNNKGNTFGTTCLIAPITTRPREKTENNPWQVYFRNGNREQAILLEQIRCVSIDKLGKYVGHIDDYTMHNVDIALYIELDLPISNQMLDEFKLACNMFNSISSGIKSKLVDFDKYINSFDNKVNKCINDIITAISLIKFESSSNNNFEDSTQRSLNNIMDILNKYNQNITILSNVLINLYNKINNNSIDVGSNNRQSINETSSNDTRDTSKEDLNNQHKSNAVKGIKINSTAEMINYLDYYMEHTFEEIENKYRFDKKSAMNRKTNYIKRLEKINVDVSKYLVRKNRFMKEKRKK